MSARKHLTSAPNYAIIQAMEGFEMLWRAASLNRAEIDGTYYYYGYARYAGRLRRVSETATGL